MTVPAWPDNRFTALFRVKYPIVQGPFGGGFSSVALAAAVADGGGVGSFGAHVLRPEQITELVADLRAATTGVFGVNLWVPLADESAPVGDLTAHVERLRPFYTELGLPAPEPVLPPPPDFPAQLAAALRAAPPVLSFVMGIPPAAAVAEARERGIRTVGTATTVDEAVAIEAAGLDAVVASGSDAGGHRGAFLRPVEESLVGTFSLVPQVADAVSIPVIAAGGIADGRGVAAALTLGADAVQIGTGFLATVESNASDPHRAALRSPAARATVLTRVFSGRTARAVPNRLLRALTAAEADLPPYPVQNMLTAPLRRAATERGLGEFLNLWAGQGAPLTRPRVAADYLADLVAATTRILSR